MALPALSNGQRELRLTDVDDALLKTLQRHADNPDFWSSKTRDRADSAHCIFQYPAMMVPLVQRRLLAAVIEAQPKSTTLWDPFVGSGTSLVSGMHYGLDVYGNDVNPLAVLISKTRTAKAVEFSVAQMADEVVRQAKADRKAKLETELANHTKWFKPEVADELSRLRRAIRKCGPIWVRRFMWVTLAETVRLTSNDRTSTYKLHARPVDDIVKRTLSPFAIFSDLASRNAKSFTAFRGALRTEGRLNGLSYRGKSDVRIADARQLGEIEAWPTAQGFDLLMTSPPYGDNRTTVTYGQHSYLPLSWIDLEDIDSKADKASLRTTQEIDRLSLGGRIRVSAEEEEILSDQSPALKAFADSLPKPPSDARTRLLQFYIDFRSSLVETTTKVTPNGYMIWTVGNRSIAGRQVPTDKILAELLEAQGCTLVTTLNRRIHHKRMPNRNASSTTMREEHILLLRRREAGPA